MKKQENYWTYQAPPTPELSDVTFGTFKGTKEEWESLSPGMRREIYRQATIKDYCEGCWDTPTSK